MINCREVAQKLFEYMDKECDETTTRDIDEHLQLCRSCFDVKEFENILREHVKTKTNHCCPEKVKKRIQDLLERF